MRDNQPKHRQSLRQGRHLARKKATRAGLPAILIVCEGKQTEPNYIHGFCVMHGINRANVVLIPGDGETSAIQLVRKARQRFQIDRDFDAVFVVCDCDGEDPIEARRQAAKPMKNASGQILAVQLIASSPCFEFWLLLHFEYLARPFPTAASVIDILERHLTDYDKADRLIFPKVRSGLERALGNARQLKTELAAIGARTPDTDMAVLIEMLMTLRRTGIRNT
ncbi:MAG TPA: RloB family protein [Steroidobacteraceae bacterium]|nr:RloB family protein [Steroidobacteraceae bacterium]